MKPDIVEFAGAAGFNLSRAETALLRGLAVKSFFDGIEYRTNEGEAGAAKEMEYWLPSVWRAKAVKDDLTPETDWETVERQVYEEHTRLYTEAPFPIISGALLKWLLSSKAVNHLDGIHLANIKVAGDLDAACKVDFGIQFTECIFESRCSLSGHIGRLGLTGVYAHYIWISGDYGDIGFNDVHCHGMRGRGPGGALFLKGVTSPRLFIYGMFVSNRVAIRDSKITEIQIIGRVLAGEIRAVRCEFQAIIATRSDEDYFIPFFSASEISVTGSCTLHNFQGAMIGDAVIRGDLVIQDMTPAEHPHLYASGAGLSLSNVEIKGRLKVGINSVARKERLEDRKIQLSFDHVRTQLYEDGREDLEAIRQLELEGLEYQELIPWDAPEIADRTRWLALQPSKPFPLASWHRLAAQFRRRGRSREARVLLIESERRRREAQDPSASARIWSWLLRISIGYGWELWRIGWFAVPLVLLGSVVAWRGMENGLLAQTTDLSARVSFNPVVYSLDSALPIIELGHSSLWIPTGQGWGGRLVQVYFWIHIALGWIIGTLFVIGFTGIAHKKSAE
jgi:hypothetical protein